MGSQRHSSRIDVHNAPVTYDVRIGDDPIDGQIRWNPAVIDQWRRGAENHPVETLNQVLRMLNDIRERKPFDREHWTAWAELGHDVIEFAPPKLTERFLIVTAGDRRGRADMRIVARSRVAIIRILQKESPRNALRAVRGQLSQLPYKETYVMSRGRHRASVVPKDPAMRETLQRYRLQLEMLLAELLEQTGREADPELIERIEQGLSHFNAPNEDAGSRRRAPPLPDAYINFINEEDVWMHDIAPHSGGMSAPAVQSAINGVPHTNGNGQPHHEEELAFA